MIVRGDGVCFSANRGGIALLFQLKAANSPPYSGTIVELKLKPFDFAQAVARAGLRPDGTPLLVQSRGRLDQAAGLGAVADQPGDFRSEMSQALRAVSQAQSRASRLQREVQLENPTVSLEETMIAMQKAQLGFQAVMQVRNRLVQAYSEVMNMQV